MYKVQFLDWLTTTLCTQCRLFCGKQLHDCLIS